MTWPVIDPTDPQSPRYPIQPLEPLVRAQLTTAAPLAFTWIVSALGIPNAIAPEPTATILRLDACISSND
jgi:hypothetical protein